MKINLTDEIRKDTNLFYFIITTLSGHEEKTGQGIDQIIPVPPPDSPPITVDVDFRINGVEIDIRAHIERMGKAYDRDVREKACEMVTSVMGKDFNDRIDELRNLFDRYEHDIREKFGLPARED